MFVLKVRGPARAEVWGGGGDIRLCEVCWPAHITRLPLPPPPPQDVGPPRQTGALGRSFIFLKGKKWDGKEGNEPRSFRMNRIDNHCQQ